MTLASSSFDCFSMFGLEWSYFQLHVSIHRCVEIFIDSFMVVNKRQLHWELLSACYIIMMSQYPQFWYYFTVFKGCKIDVSLCCSQSICAMIIGYSWVLMGFRCLRKKVLLPILSSHLFFPFFPFPKVLFLSVIYWLDILIYVS